jgi:putative transposase
MGVEIRTVQKITCKHCGSEDVKKYGQLNGIPRYFCKSCNRKFKADDNLVGMRLPTEQISTALHDYYDGGSSVRSIGRHILSETGKTPSTATIYEWIQKYSQYLTESIKDYHPTNIGNEWVADETVLKIGGSQLWLWDIIDTKTRVLLASRLSRRRSKQDAQILIDNAVKMAGHEPKTVATDQLVSYLDVFYGKDADHIQGSPFSHKEKSTSLIERWHGTLKGRTKVMRGLKNFETAHDFTKTYLAYYNFLRPHESLGKTPMAEAGVSYPYKDWNEVIRNYKPKAKIVITHVPYSPSPRPKTHIGRPHGSKNPYLKMPKERVLDLGGGIVFSRGRRHLRLD